LVLDEADRILDSGFKKAVNAIISQLPKRRQTMLFSATQTKSVQDLARLSLKDPEYISVHEEAVTATPTLLKQAVMIVPLDQKLDMLWSFIKRHLQSKTLVFLSSCKQVTPLLCPLSRRFFYLIRITCS
jgi:ATP-dependent RNA helicase DDX10/DBP4